MIRGENPLEYEDARSVLHGGYQITKYLHASVVIKVVKDESQDIQICGDGILLKEIEFMKLDPPSEIGRPLCHLDLVDLILDDVRSQLGIFSRQGEAEVSVSTRHIHHGSPAELFPREAIEEMLVMNSPKCREPPHSLAKHRRPFLARCLDRHGLIGIVLIGDADRAVKGTQVLSAKFVVLRTHRRDAFRPF